MAADIAAAAPLSLAEAKAYCRIEHDDEDALIAGLVRTAAALCEAFVGALLLRRTVTETVAADGGWRALSGWPVVAVEAVEAVEAGDPGGVWSAVPAERWSARIEASGTGWVRVTGGGAVRVAARAGIADDWNEVPEPLRQGMARLVAHLHACRDRPDDAGPPAAVAALWRPWRRVRLG